MTCHHEADCCITYSSSKLGRRAQYKATPTPGKRAVHKATNSGATFPSYPLRDKSSGMNDAAAMVRIAKSKEDTDTIAVSENKSPYPLIN